jgi:cell wall-associated NlpC family hydrolase
MNFSKNDLIKILPIISSVCLFNGCVQKNQLKKNYHISYQTKTIYKPKTRYVNYKPKRVYHPTQSYNQRRPNHIQFPRDKFFKRPQYIENEKNLASNQINPIDRITQVALSQMGKTYSWGATGPFKFDCSGFTQFVYEQNGIELPRVSREQAKEGEYIDRDSLRKGDLIFFSSSKSDDVHHVGIYLGNGKFVHASSAKKRVTISSLNEKYYKKHFKWGRRLINPRSSIRFASN